MATRPHPTPPARLLSRRAFQSRLLTAGALLVAAPARSALPSPALLSGARPALDLGVASGDITGDTAVIWSRTDRPARMIVEWSTSGSWKSPRRVVGPVTGPEADFTAKTILKGLPPGQRIAYRVRFEGRGPGTGELSHPASGEFTTPSRHREDVTFAWSGDTCGQGFGIDPAHGGLLTYESIRREQPDFFIHSGDMIYADNPLAAETRLADGTMWRNVVTEEKSKVAETLDEFRGNYRYNLLDPHVRALNAALPTFAQWDDHEVRNNWYPGQKLDADARYRVKDVDLLVTRARQAFLEYAPLRPTSDRRIFRHLPRGPLCDLFFLDLRSYRAANGPNLEATSGPTSTFLGEPQLDWLEHSLRRSRGLWKVICSDMPLGLLVADGADRWEAFSNGDHTQPRGRELEVARLLRFLRREKIQNVFWITADVHYAAAHHYDPSRAAFAEFNPFWEFVSGPLHAGTFGPGNFDRTFGPELRWSARPPGAPQNLPPSANEQFFGTVRIHADSGIATITQRNRLGEKLWSIELPPAAA